MEGEMNTKTIQSLCKAVLKKAAIICLLMVFSFGLSFGQNWETGSLEDALAKAKASDKLLLLDFFQEYG